MNSDDLKQNIYDIGLMCWLHHKRNQSSDETYREICNLTMRDISKIVVDERGFKFEGKGVENGYSEESDNAGAGKPDDDKG